MSFGSWLNDQKKNLESSAGWLSTKINEQKKNAEDAIMKVTNQNFKEAIVAGCAMIAAADGKMAVEEKEKMVILMKGSSILSLYDLNEILATFNKYADAMILDYATGKKECMDAVLKVKDNAVETPQIINFCSLIASADNDFDEKEQAVIKELCLALNLNPAEYGL